MGKKSKHNDGLSKSERRALEQREAALEAELEARAAQIKGKSKSKANATLDVTTMKRKALKSLAKDREAPKAWRKAAKAELQTRAAADLTTRAPIEKSAPAKAEKVKPDPKGDVPVKPAKPEKSAKARVTEAAEGVLAGVSSEGAVEAAEAALEAAAEASDDETDEQIKARVKAKREAREAAAVKGGSGKPVAPDIAGSARNDDALEGESEVEYQTRKRTKRESAKLAESEATRLEAAGIDITTDEAQTYLADVAHGGEIDETYGAKPKGKSKAQAVEPVETETGTIYAAGESVAVEEFGKPSEAPAVDFETNGNGQYKVKRPSDGKVVGYTRVTTFIGTNEDRTLLEKWKLRILLEGVAINDTFDPAGDERRGDPVVAKVADLIHRRDVAIAKARKKDRKLELAPGQYGTIVEAAWSEFKKALDALAEELLELGGAHEKAAKGTQLHELTELYDREGIDAVGELLVEGKITHADLADVEAYARAIEAAGIKILPEYIECPVVIHDEKIAGRLDRVVMARLPGAGRAARYVFDTKTGRIDLGAGKIAQQLEKYARATPYNLDTHETLEPHKASMTKGLVLHLVPGSAEAHIYVVDLGTGRVGNDLSAKVRAFRNDGKRSIDMTVDLAKQEAVA